MSEKRSWVTAGEVIDAREQRLRDDPVYRAEFEAANRIREEAAQRRVKDAEPIMNDLRAAGVVGVELWNLGKPDAPWYEAAVPVLLHHLEKGEALAFNLGFVGGALAHKPVFPFWQRLRRCYLNASFEGQEEAAAIAMVGCSGSKKVHELMDFILMEDKGESRIFFVKPILRWGGERGAHLIQSLQNHPIVGVQASESWHQREVRRRRRERKMAEAKE